MSAKIHDAWRIPLSRLGEATDHLHQDLSKQFEESWWNALDKAFADGGWRKKITVQVPDQGTDQDFAEFASIMEQEMAASWERNRILREIYTTGFWFLIEGEFAYILPLGNFPINPAGWFEDFSYWGNTDRPESLDQAEWDERGKVWDRIWLSAPNREYRHYVVDPSDGFFIATGSYTLRWVQERREAYRKNQEKKDG